MSPLDVLLAQPVTMQAWLAWMFAVNFASVLFLRRVQARWAAAAMAGRLGNRSALEWILDQYKERKPEDPTIRENLDTYRFADYKEKVIDLLMRVTRVSVQTQAIVEAMKTASH